MLQIYKQSAYVSKLDFYFGHFTDRECIQGRTQDSNFQGGGGGGGGGQVFPGDGKCGSRGGGQGDRTPPPPGKSQVIWVSLGNKQLDPPGISWNPLENVGPPCETLKNCRFL